MPLIGSVIHPFGGINNLRNHVRRGFVVYVLSNLCSCTHTPGLGSHGTARLQP